MGKNTVLVVDDEKDIRELIEIYLINEGLKVVTACDGADALEKLNNNDIDLIILDIMMPKLDGIRTCLKIREEKKLPIIILSDKNEDSDKILGLNVGPMNTVGDDRMIIETGAFGSVKIKKFEHIKSYPLPPNWQHIIKKPY